MRPEEHQPLAGLIACDECDLLQRPIVLPAGGWALCRRCDGPLYRYSPGSLDRALAFSFGAVVMFFIGITFPILELEIQGHVTSSSIYLSVQQLWNHDMRALAVLMAATTMVVPTFQLTIMISVLLLLRLRWAKAWLPPLLRFFTFVRPWSMTEIFFMGILVALVKLSHMADTMTGVALWALGGMMMLLVAANVSFNLHDLWKQVSPS